MKIIISFERDKEKEQKALLFGKRMKIMTWPAPSFRESLMVSREMAHWSFVLCDRPEVSGMLRCLHGSRSEQHRPSDDT